MTRRAEIDRLKGYMTIIVRADDISEWERKFCASMISMDKRGTFIPSKKQIAAMQRIVAKFQVATMRDDIIEK